MMDPSPSKKKQVQKNFARPSGLNIKYQTDDGTAIRPPMVMNVIAIFGAPVGLLVIAMRSLLRGNLRPEDGRSYPTTPQHRKTDAIIAPNL